MDLSRCTTTHWGTGSYETIVQVDFDAGERMKVLMDGSG